MSESTSNLHNNSSLITHHYKKTFNKVFLYTVFAYGILIACAQQQPLTGGNRDETPPKMDMEISTPNYQTNFEKQQLEFHFDEYIELKNATKEVFISPPLDRLPRMTVKLKTLYFEFPEEEVLKEGATYSINFGDAVKDLTEGNAVPDFKFVFSTGEFIDSLKVEGTIVDALTGEAVADALYMLYDDLADSVVYTTRPFYFGKTDKTGKFLIENVKAGQYKGFALEDQDLNYLYNIPTERIGFSMDTIVITDSTTQTITAAIFEATNLVAKPKANLRTYGVVPLNFKGTPYDVRIELEEVGQARFIETIDDTIKVWYHTRDSIDWNIFVHRDTLTDTIGVKALPKKLDQKKLRLLAKRKTKGKPTAINLNPMKPIKLTFNHPIQTIDTSFIRFQEGLMPVSSTTNNSMDTTEMLIDTSALDLGKDTMLIDTSTLNLGNDTMITAAIDTTSTAITAESATFIQATYQRDSLEQRTMTITYPWKETLEYQLQLLPGAITDLYGLTNTDTIELSYLVKEQKDFGNIKLSITGMDSLQNYYFELLFATNIVESFQLTGVKSHQRTFTSLPAGNYSVKVIEDLNGNGRWDSGNYDTKLQPEKISTAALEELKANWDVEAAVEVEFKVEQSAEKEE